MNGGSSSDGPGSPESSADSGRFPGTGSHETASGTGRFPGTGSHETASETGRFPGTRWFVRGDWDGFFGLFIDNLLQLMLIVELSGAIAGLPPEIVDGRILPGAAVSILAGNLFYAWQARRTRRADATALPYGINTPSLFAYIFFIMGPVYRESHSAELAWRVGLFACFASGVLEIAGAFAGDWLRKHTPRAALLSALAGIAITFISMSFVFQIFATPAVALLPAVVILVAYGARIRLPFGLPGGVVAVLAGVALAWFFRLLDFRFFQPPEVVRPSFHFPRLYPGDVLEVAASQKGLEYMSIIFPMALFNVIGSLQNLESAEAAGDRYETRPSLLANGLGSVVAAFFGSAFPTTIYIGHPGWKAMGARAGYSVLNGAVITALCFFGGMSLVRQAIPIEAAIGILLWIGIIILAQAFQEVPKSHALAVALGLLPSLAAWVLTIVEQALRVAGKNLAQVSFPPDFSLEGIIRLSQGFLVSSMLLSAILVFIIEREFTKAALWTLAAAALSMIGIIHAYELTGQGEIRNKFGLAAAPWFALAYSGSAMVLFAVGFSRRRESESP